MTEPWKFGVLTPDGAEREHRYPTCWCTEPTAGPERIVVSVDGGHSELLLSLAELLPEPLGVLYVLLASRRGQRPGRYQAPDPMPLSGVRAFVRDFAPFLELDARHHVWLSSLSAPATLVYDNHNLIYAYGDLAAFQGTLEARGVQERSVEIPAPHVHRYNPEFDADEDRIMKRWDWIHFPLEDSDDP